MRGCENMGNILGRAGISNVTKDFRRPLTWIWGLSRSLLVRSQVIDHHISAFLSFIGAAHVGATALVYAAPFIDNRVWLSCLPPDSTKDWAQIGHRCGPRAFEV